MSRHTSVPASHCGVLPMLNTIHTPLCRECGICEVGIIRHAKGLRECRICGPRVEARNRESEARLAAGSAPVQRNLT